MNEAESTLDAAIRAAVDARAEAKQKLAAAERVARAAAYEFVAAQRYVNKLRAVRAEERKKS